MHCVDFCSSAIVHGVHLPPSLLYRVVLAPLGSLVTRDNQEQLDWQVEMASMERMARKAHQDTMGNRVLLEPQ